LPGALAFGTDVMLVWRAGLTCVALFW